MNTYTDTQLKQALAKMLPETLIWDDETSQHNTDRPQDESWGLCWDSGNPVLDTELLHLCWMVERNIPSGGKWCDYVDCLSDVANTVNKYAIRATWQQRTIALTKTLGVEII